MNKIAMLCSGGVDSSVALYLLKEQGYDITVFYIKIWLEDELSYLNNCPWEEDISYIKKICNQLNINLEQIPLQKEYYELVIKNSINLIKKGCTPNPDVFCNSMIKFGAFYEEYGKKFDKIATGHYAKWEEKNKWKYLKICKDKIKDQTYFLAYTEYQKLNKILFPLQQFESKLEVRNFAKEHNIPSALKKDSQGICFLGKIPFIDFIKHHCGEKEGFLIDYDSKKIIGKHKGFWFYTIGQRHGIGLSGGPWYVISKDCIENIIYISIKSPEQYFKKNDVKIKIKEINYLVPKSDFLCINNYYTVKLRHGKNTNKIKIINVFDDNNILCILENEDQGIADGQFMVFYDTNENCIGSGIMEVIK
jgi:tRNA-specific 2-thiouridylase